MNDTRPLLKTSNHVHVNVVLNSINSILIGSIFFFVTSFCLLLPDTHTNTHTYLILEIIRLTSDNINFCHERTNYCTIMAKSFFLFFLKEQILLVYDKKWQKKNLISITLLFFLPYLLFLIQNSLFHNHDDDRKKEKKKLNENRKKISL